MAVKDAGGPTARVSPSPPVANQPQTKQGSLNKSFVVFLALLGFRDNESGEQFAHRGRLSLVALLLAVALALLLR
jgi:hypothetical protein